MEQDCSGHTEQRTLLLVSCRFHNLFQIQKAQKTKASGAHLILNSSACLQDDFNDYSIGRQFCLCLSNSSLNLFLFLMTVHICALICSILGHIWLLIASTELSLRPLPLMEGVIIIPILCLWAFLFSIIQGAQGRVGN